MAGQLELPKVPLILDSIQLDEELESMLYEKCEGVCAHAGGLISYVQPELRALLRGTLWYLSATGSNASPAQLLLNMHCADRSSMHSLGYAIEATDAARTPSGSCRVPRLRSVLYGALVVLVPWAWARLSQLASDPDHPERLRWLRWMRKAEGYTKLASVLVTFHFIYTRRSPTLPMALLGLQLVHTRPQQPRRPNFELLEQQLVWRTVAEFAVAVRGFYHSGGRVVTAAGMRPAVPAAGDRLMAGVAAVGRRLGLVAAEPASSVPASDDAVASLGVGGCVFCDACPAHTPTPAPCGHMCCYFCLSVARMTSARAVCPRCQVRLVTS